MVYIGADAYAYTRPEATFGIDPGSSANEWVGLIQNANPTNRNNQIRVWSLGGGRSYTNIVPGKYEVSASLEYNVQNGRAFKYALGSTLANDQLDFDGVTDISVNGLYRHKVRENSSGTPLKSFTLQHGSGVGTPNVIQTYTGCKVNSMTISAEKEDLMKATIDLLARAMVNGSTTSSTPAVADNPYVFYQGLITVDSTVVAFLNSFELTLTNNVEPYWGITRAQPAVYGASDTGREARFMIEKQREYEIRFDAVFESSFLLEKFLGATSATFPIDNMTPFAIVLTFDNFPSDLTNANRRALQIRLSNVLFEETSIPTAPNELIIQSMTGFTKSAEIDWIDNDSAVA